MDRSPEWKAKKRAYMLAYMPAYKERNREAIRENLKEYCRNRLSSLRKEAILRYGGNPPSCACCGESNYEFLGINHINGGGNKHRGESKGSYNYMSWFKKNNFPPGFNVLCHNCNLSMGFYGYCPHKAKPQEVKNV